MLNISTENTTIELDYLSVREQKIKASLVPDIVILSLYIFLGVVGNVGVIYFYKVKITRRKDKRNRFFILYLSIIDILACVFGASFGIVLDLQPLSFGNDIACKCLTFLIELSVLTSGFILLVISVERFKLVCRPFKEQMTSHCKRVSTAATIICSIVLSVPSVFLFGKIAVYDQDKNMIGVTCGKLPEPELELWIIIHDITLAFLCTGGMITMVVLYTLIAKGLYDIYTFRKDALSVRYTHRPSDFGQDTSFSQTLSDSIDKSEEAMTKAYINGSDTYTSLSVTKKRPSQKYLRKSESLRFSVMFIFITLIYFLAYVPRLCVMLHEVLEENFWGSLTESQFLAYVILSRIYIFNNVVNPFVYGCFDEKLKAELKLILYRCGYKNDESDTQ